MLIPIIIATAIVGIISLIGILIVYKKNQSVPSLKSFISLAAGALLTVSFLDLLPEALEKGTFEPQLILGVTLGSIVFFFLFEKALHWHHCRCQEDTHTHKNTVSPGKQHLIYFNLVGDALHNLVDGFLIAGAFLLDVKTGMAVTAAVILHEIPQEISDFGILLYAGLSRGRAILYNISVALTAIGGAILFYFFGNSFEMLLPLIAAFAAGNFIYLATADLIPELHHENDAKKVLIYSIWLLIGVALMLAVGFILPHAE